MKIASHGSVTTPVMMKINSQSVYNEDKKKGVFIDTPGSFMKLIDKLKMMHALTSGEQAVCDFIIDHPIAFITQSKTELLTSLGLSQSTLYRFCHKISSRGYDHVRLRLAQELLMSQDPALLESVDVNYPFKPGDSLETIARNLARVYRVSVTQTMQHLDLQDLRQAVQVLRTAEEICLITSNTNTVFAERFSNQLKEIGKRVRISSSPYKWKLETVDLSERDVLIINSYAGRSSKVFLHLLPELHQRKVPIILMGSTHNTSFIPHAQYRLFMCDLEDPKSKISSFSTDVSSAYLFDVLSAALYQDHYDENLKKHLYIYD